MFILIYRMNMRFSIKNPLIKYKHFLSLRIVEPLFSKILNCEYTVNATLQTHRYFEKVFSTTKQY